MGLHFLNWITIIVENKFSVNISLVCYDFHFFTLDRCHGFGSILHAFHSLPDSIDRTYYDRGSRNSSCYTHDVVSRFPNSVTRFLYCWNMILQHLYTKTYYRITS